jgi:hypothetical protein
MKHDGELDEQPQQQLCISLNNFLTSNINESHQIILGSNFNNKIGLDMNGITQVITKHNLTDVMRTSLGAADKPATYT